MRAVEVNFDGLVGLTHHYAGLALGNLASEKNAYKVSNPQQAALQGLEKMHLLMSLGIPQAVLPPHERPYLPALMNLGFSGSVNSILQDAYLTSPKLFRAIYSASSMWTANAATVTPSVDSQDGRVHLTPANLVSHFHRSIETKMTEKLFRKIFSNEKYFVVHEPLCAQPDFSDEGAANHNRLCVQYGKPGHHIFVYSRSSKTSYKTMPKRYPARQSLEASQAIARLHQINPENTLFIKQNPAAIDLGVFHNDVISVANQNVFFFHQEAFQNLKKLKAFLHQKLPEDLCLLPVSADEISVSEAVKSYLFNSQIVTLPDKTMVVIAPNESKEGHAYQVLLRLLEEKTPIKGLHFVNCGESMGNGGGPACLRLRVVLMPEELQALHASVVLDEFLYHSLVSWVKKHYRDRLEMEDLLDPELIKENETALDELTKLLKLGSLYNFQKV